MTQHFVPVHSASAYLKPEESRLTEFDRDLPSILAPATSFGPHVSITGSPLPRTEAKADFKIVYVNGGEDVLINNEDEARDGK